ncbi:MAG: leucine-rich repeat domain-containing protein [Bacteroidales bacterium]|nr:leucine-rich repeat domain-containing protein [Bacteroidales bacterium]
MRLLLMTLWNLDYGAFGACPSLESVTLPKSLKYIGQYAFAASGISSITIPKNVTTVGKSAFSMCTNLDNTNSGKTAPQTSTALPESLLPTRMATK